MVADKIICLALRNIVVPSAVREMIHGMCARWKVNPGRSASSVQVRVVCRLVLCCCDNTIDPVRVTNRHIWTVLTEFFWSYLS